MIFNICSPIIKTPIFASKPPLNRKLLSNDSVSFSSNIEADNADEETENERLIDINDEFKELSASKKLKSKLFYTPSLSYSSSKESNSTLINQGMGLAVGDFISGNILAMAGGMNNDFNKISLTQYIKYQLKRLEQFSLITMLPDGIQEANLIAVRRLSVALPKDKKQEILNTNIYTINPDETIEIFAGVEANQGLGYSMNKQNYYKALQTILKNPKTPSSELPIIINTEFYEKAKKAHGELTPEEVLKADEYKKAWNEYLDREEAVIQEFHNIKSPFGFVDFIHGAATKTKQNADSVIFTEPKDEMVADEN